MAFCEFSNEVVGSSSTMVDNLFLSDFMPNVDGDYVKVYLYGLYKCSSSRDNTIESFETNLQMGRDDIVSIFYYWQEMGLVNVINVDPIQVRYLPVKNALVKMKKYNVDKYAAFNISAQELIGSKMLTPREFEEFYYLIENMKMEKEAVLKVIEYCVKLKGENVSVSYVVAVAKSWAYDGVRTSEQVDERLEAQERISGDVVLVLKALGIKRSASVEEYQQYLIWTTDFDMPLDLIVHIAKKTKVKNFSRLNDMVMKMYSNRLLSTQEIDDYLKSYNDMFVLAKEVVKNLGLWYDNLENVVDTYISNWLALGFEREAIVALSNMAFKSNIRTLEGLNNSVNAMFKVGVLTMASIDSYMQDIVKNDMKIASILSELGINRAVVSQDRAFYKAWVYDWNLNDEIIMYAVGLSKGKYSAIQYLNRILADYHQSGITSLEDAKSHKLSCAPSAEKSGAGVSKKAGKREYSRKELESLFDDITEVEI